MYDEVAVCAACFEEYSRRDTERAKALAQAQARARAFVVASEAKYAKFQGKGTRRKVNPANSGLIKRYEARRAQEKRAKQDMLEQGRKDKELRKLQLQTKRKDMRKITMKITTKTWAFLRIPILNRNHTDWVYQPQAIGDTLVRRT